MKKNTVFIFLLLFTAISYAQDFAVKKEKPIIIAPPRDSLTIGETLEYSVEWLGIPIGIMSLKVEGIENINNHPCYHLSGKATPNKFFRKFYDMEYNIHSYLDRDKLVSRRFEKIKRIKDALVYIVAEFDPEKEQAKYTYYSPSGPIETVEFPSLKKSVISNKVETVSIPNNSLDLLSSLYWLRLSKKDLHQEQQIQIAYERNVWNLSIKVEKLVRKDIHKKGSFQLMEVYPDSDLNEQVLGKRKIYASFTTDSLRLPVEFRIHSNVGFLRGIIKNPPVNRQ